MATKFNQTRVIFTLKMLILTSLSKFASPLEPYECPYPCLPAPAATTPGCPSPPASEAPPLLPSTPSSFYYPPPPSGWFYPPPVSGFPFYPPPDYVNNYFAPPPPNPILPYFPFYYKNPPPPFDFSSASISVPPSLMAFCILLIAQLLFTKSL